MIRKIFAPTLFALSAFSVSLLKPAQAQISIDPLVEVTETRQGQATGFVTVKNNSNEEFRARVFAVPFIYDRERGFQEVDSSEDDLTPYLVYAPRELAVPPNATRRIRYIIRLPPDRTESEYRAALFTETLGESETQQSGNSSYVVQQVNRIGTTLYIRSKNLPTALSVTSAEYISVEDSVRLLLNNTGEATVRPEISWTITKEGKNVASGLIDRFTVMEQAERYTLISKPQDSQSPDTTEDTTPFLQPGQYQVKGTIRWENFDSQEQENFELSFAVP